MSFSGNRCWDCLEPVLLCVCPEPPDDEEQFPDRDREWPRCRGCGERGPECCCETGQQPRSWLDSRGKCTRCEQPSWLCECREEPGEDEENDEA
jgi:hypothetical protein